MGVRTCRDLPASVSEVTGLRERRAALPATRRKVLECDLRHLTVRRAIRTRLSLISFSSPVPEAAGFGWVLPSFAVNLRTSLIPWLVGRALSDGSAELFTSCRKKVGSSELLHLLVCWSFLFFFQQEESSRCCLCHW